MPPSLIQQFSTDCACRLTTLLEFEKGFAQGWHQEFSDGGLNCLMRGLKRGFQGTINAEDLRKITFHLLMGVSML